MLLVVGLGDRRLLKNLGRWMYEKNPIETTQADLGSNNLRVDEGYC